VIAGDTDDDSLYGDSRLLLRSVYSLTDRISCFLDVRDHPTLDALALGHTLANNVNAIRQRLDRRNDTAHLRGANV
jgi:hypothetical protein